MQGRNLGFVLAGIYLGVCLLLLSLLFIGPPDALNGVPAMLLTLPWSLLLLKLCLPHPASMIPGVLALLASALLNASLLFLIGWSVRAKPRIEKET